MSAECSTCTMLEDALRYRITLNYPGYRKMLSGNLNRHIKAKHKNVKKEEVRVVSPTNTPLTEKLAILDRLITKRGR